MLEKSFMYKDMPGLLENHTPKIHYFKSISDYIAHLKTLGLYKKNKRFLARFLYSKNREHQWAHYIIELGQLPLGYANHELFSFIDDLNSEQDFFGC